MDMDNENRNNYINVSTRTVITFAPVYEMNGSIGGGVNRTEGRPGSAHPEAMNVRPVLLNGLHSPGAGRAL